MPLVVKGIGGLVSLGGLQRWLSRYVQPEVLSAMA
jgi:hypothetical protein